MNNSKFKWTMTEEQFCRMKNTISKTKISNEGCFGNVYFGNYCVDIVLNEYEQSRYVNLDFYHIGVDSGYGYTKGKGTPYDFEDNINEFFFAKDVVKLNLEDFKKQAEKKIVERTTSKFSKDYLEKEVSCPLADWR